MLVALLAAFSACNQDEIARNKTEKDSLLTVIRTKESEMKQQETSINDFISSFNEVERNLDSVSSRQQILYLHADKARGDVKSSQKERINSQIAAINNLMESNRATIASLKSKLKGSTRTNARLKETIATLTAQLQQKDQELAALNEKLASLNAQVAQLQTGVDSLSSHYTSHSKTIAENTIAMHTAYYIVGRTKDLYESKVIDRKGGLLGMGKTSRLSSNIDNSRFTRIDYTKTTTIDINSSNVRVITTHPGDSYRLENDPAKKGAVKTLVITNPDKFWSASKYLVVEGNPLQSDKSLSSGNSSEKKL